jgi:hypothetical protein
MHLTDLNSLTDMHVAKKMLRLLLFPNRSLLSLKRCMRVHAPSLFHWSSCFWHGRRRSAGRNPAATFFLSWCSQTGSKAVKWKSSL